MEAGDLISKRNGNDATELRVVSSVVYASRGAKKTAFVLNISHKRKLEEPAKAFDLLVNFWSERRDLNSGPPVPQTGALTGLRYAPNGKDYSSRRQTAQPNALANTKPRGYEKPPGG